MKSITNPRYISILSMLIILLLIDFAFADKACKIAGKVTDSVTGDSIVSVAIEVKGTQLGAYTDVNGEFFIVNVPPGLYELKFSYVGYHSMTVKDVYVTTDLTTTVDVRLTPSNLKMETVEIIYMKPNFELDQSTVKKKYTGSLKDLKPQDASAIVKLSQGFKIGDDGKRHIRGSRSGDAAIIVEDVDLSIADIQLDMVSPPPRPESPLEMAFSRANNQRFSRKPSIPPYPIMPPYPLPNLTGEEYNKFKENEFLDVTEHPLSTFSIDVDNASYTNSRRYINDGMLPPHDAIRIEEFINYFDYDYTQPKSDDPVSIITEISECPWNPDNRLIHVGLQGKTISYKKLPPSNIVFLLDVSGSMSSPDKLPLLKSSFKLLIEELRKKDKVAIVVYASSTGMVLESTPGNEKEKLHEAVDRLHSGGSTAGGAGIQLAYKTAKENFIKKGNNRVILATDGDFNVGTTDNDALVKLIREKANDGIFLTVLGFGTGNLKDERMEHIADKGNGNYHYIDNILEGKKALVKEMGGLFTIAKDVKLQIEFNPARIQAYRLIGYENRMLAARDFNDDTKDAGEIGSGHTVTALYEIMLPGMDAVRRPAVDPLKYQKAEIVTTGEFEDEVMTVKLRYKPPDEDTSKLIVRAVKDEHIQLRKTSDNFRFSAAVAEFGLLLRDSEFKANASYEQIIRLAKDAKGKDTEGYRAEFIRLVETGELLSK